MADDHFTGEMAGYRPVSGLAVAALLAGCCSALVLFTPLAAVVPLVALVMAVAALAELRREEGRKVGRLAALAGLALAIGFTAQASAGGVIDRWIASRRAAATARAWIDAVREARFADALGMSSPAALPPPDGDPFAQPPTAAERLEAFRGLEAVARVTACGAVRLPVSVERDAAGEGGWAAHVPLDGCGRAGEALTLRVEPRPSTRGRELVDRWLVTGFALGR